ncbi:CG2 omega domain protein [Photobacterium minamisatsumaniensis]|uniref:CG2 omega domain protein n=1 Tax=Photobacterium minamisatsumaniensis TaxID=2910233 RepID=UPI003D11F1DF
MTKWLFILIALTSSTAIADVKVSGDGFELSKDCLRLESDNIKITSEECEKWKKNNQDNRSIHGDDNPGKGNKKDHKDKKNKS